MECTYCRTRSHHCINSLYRSPEASWHTDYRDTAYVYIGGLPFELSEGDVITIFSQFGEPTYINLVRDKETGKSRGFAFLKYEDQRSTDLAVDNLGGAVVMGRTLRVDHTRYKKKDGEEETGVDLTKSLNQPEESGEGEGRRKRRRTSESESEEERPMLKEEIELQKLLHDHDDDDPMKAFLVEEKREEISQALARVKHGKKERKDTEKRHRHHHRSRRERDEDHHGSDSRRRKDRERSKENEDRDKHRRSRREVDEKRRSRSRSKERERDRDDRKHREIDRERRRRRDSTPERRHQRRDSA